MYCLPYIANNMSADALDTLGARASAGIVLIPKANYFVASIRRVDSWINVDSCQLDVHVKNTFKMHNVKLNKLHQDYKIENVAWKVRAIKFIY